MRKFNDDVIVPIFRVASILGPILAFFFMLFYVFGHNQYQSNENNVSKVNKVEQIAPKAKSDSDGKYEDTLADFLEKYKDKYSTLVPYKVNSTNHLFYYNSEGKLILLSKVSSFVTDKNENDLINLLEDNQSEFNKETANILNQFKTGDSKTKIEILSSKAGKAHLLYQYQSKNLSENLSGLFLDITIYYNPGSEDDKLAESLNLIVDYSEKSGKIYRLNLVDVNKADPLELEEIRYSGDIIAISHPVQISDGGMPLIKAVPVNYLSFFFKMFNRSTI